MGTLGNVWEHFWLIVGGWVSIWCAEPENATTHSTGRPPTGEGHTTQLPTMHSTGRPPTGEGHTASPTPMS